MKPLVFSIAVGSYKSLFESCIRTHRAYSARWGYEYLLVEHLPRAVLATEASWLKIGLIRAALENGYPWVGFIDADCDVRRHAPSFVERFAAIGSAKSVFLAPGISGRLNAGVIFARNSPEAIAFFREVEGLSDCEVPAPGDRAPYENGHVIHCAKNNPSVGVLIHKEWNNNSVMDRRSYIQHYSGGPLRQWYLDNRTPGALQRKCLRIGRKIVSKAARTLRLTGPTRHFESANSPSRSGQDSVTISQSMKELMPFLQKRYPTFA